MSIFTQIYNDVDIHNDDSHQSDLTFVHTETSIMSDISDDTTLIQNTQRERE